MFSECFCFADSCASTGYAVANNMSFMFKPAAKAPPRSSSNMAGLGGAAVAADGAAPDVVNLTGDGDA